MHWIIELIFKWDYFWFFYILINIVFAITVHEFTHLRVASKFWDDTWYREGRMNLNPVNHLDLIWSILFIFSWFWWGKPAPIDYYKLRNPEKSFMLSALAWPLSNFLIAITFVLTAKFLIITELWSQIILNFMIYWIYINIWLMVFNLMPVPPLDWSRLVRYIMRNNYNFLRNWSYLESQFIFVILLVIFFSPIIWKITEFISNYLIYFLQ